MNRLRKVSLAKLMLLWLPAGLVLLAAVSVYWLLHTASGAAWLWNKVEDAAAGTVHSRQVEGDLASGFVIRGLQYRSDTVDVSAFRAEIKAEPGWWPVSIQVRALVLQDIDIVTRVPAATVTGAGEETDIRSILAALELPVPVKVHDAVLSNISIQQGHEPSRLLVESLRFQATLDERLVLDQVALLAPGIEAGLHGNLMLQPPFELAVAAQGRLEMSGMPGGVELVFPFRLESSGTLDQVQFGLFSQQGGLQLDNNLLDLAMSGSASTSNIQISSATLTSAAMNLAINIEADIDIEAHSVDAKLDWSGLSWPLANAAADFSSPYGKLTVSGSLDQWASTGQLELKLGDYPPGKLEIQASGDRTSARLTLVDGDVLGGSIDGEVNADWAGDLSWDARIRSRGVDPEPLLPGWPGRLDGEIQISAQQPERVRINILSLQGQLRGIELSASGGLDIEGNSVSFNEFELRPDGAVLQLDGSVMDPAGVAVKFDGKLPSTLLQGASGSLALQGSYSSHSDQPLLDVQLEARDLAWNGFSVKSLAVNTSESGAAVPALQLDASGLVFQEVAFDELSMSVNPVDSQHRLKVKLANEEISLRTTLTLAAENTDDLLGSPWHGVFDEVEVLIGQAWSFSLLKPAALQWSAGSASMGPLCLREDGGAGLCLGGEYQATGDWSLVADVTAVPLDYMRDMLELDVHFEQQVEGRMEWHQLQNRAPTGGADFRITAGRIFDLDDNEPATETNEGRFAFTLKNGNLESGVLDIEFPGTGFIDIDFNVEDIIDEGARILQGRAIVRMNDIGPLGHLAFPGLDDIDGVFESEIRLGGTLADPDFNGGFRLSGGFLQYVPLGLKLEDIEFEGQVENHDLGGFKGQFRAGEGVGSIEGQFQFEDIENLHMTVSFSGDQLLLVNTDALKLNAETDLKFDFSPQRTQINGFIRVPSARLTPANLLLGKATDSEDLIIENDPDRLQSGVDDSASENRVYGQLQVAFGDDVFIKVPGVETNISGSVVFDWSGDPVPLAQGSYELEGKVDVYGPTLMINKGHISFPEVPADNPLLNIRAEREIYGNTQIRAAGVQLIGTLKRPLLEAYTVPVTTEDRAWTLLVTGTDFDQGQGVGGFDVGTYIAPKLYVSYGISLFDDENVISARYDLKKGFGVKVASGQRETGLDISYTIDK